MDVEPAGFQLDGPDPAQWDGFAWSAGLVDEVTDALAARTGRRAVVGWYVRMDPQITAVYGRADHAVHAFPGLVATRRARGDYFGLHVHPVRRATGAIDTIGATDTIDATAWVHDYADPDLVVRATEHAADAFGAALGTPPRRHRCGIGAMAEPTMATLDRLGIDVDLSMERSRGDLSEVHSGVDASPVVGRTADCTGAPRAAYRPRVGAFAPPGDAGTPGRAAPDGARRRVAVIPLTTTTWRRRPRRPGPLVRRALGRRPGPQVMFPNQPWPSPRRFWDLALAEADRMDRPYLSFAIRTDHPDSVPSRRAAAVLRALPDHPIAGRLDLVDPLDVVDDLVGPT